MTIEVEYITGSVVWFLVDGKIESGTIDSLSVYIDPSGRKHETYSGPRKGQKLRFSSTHHVLFPTKEALINSL